MKKVLLRDVTRENYRDCVNMVVRDDQLAFVAPNMQSLAEAKVNPLLHPHMVYDDRIRGMPPGPDDPPVGFVMYQLMEGVAFVTRLMIDPRFQGQGYGRATMVECIRRFKMMPDIEFIGTSVLKTNDAAHALYRSLGFVDGPKEDEREFYLKLDWDPKEG